jgi:hypothetical protein
VLSAVAERAQSAALYAASGPVVIAVEPFRTMWPDARKLAAEHFIEVDEDVEPKRPFKLNEKITADLEAIGCLKIMTARVNGEMVGYCTWQIAPDIESEGLVAAFQGAWFVAPRWKGLGDKLFRFAKAELKRLGVHIMFPHHRLQGRGAELGAYFRRQGAREIQHTYSLWIGG